MKKNLIVITTSLFIGIFIGYILTSFLIEPIPQNYVRVTVENKSHHVIKSLTLTYNNGNMKVTDILDNHKIKLLFPCNGENSYKIETTFDNDSVVSSHGSYVESGYSTIETVYETEIKTQCLF